MMCRHAAAIKMQPLRGTYAPTHWLEVPRFLNPCKADAERSAARSFQAAC